MNKNIVDKGYSSYDFQNFKISKVQKWLIIFILISFVIIMLTGCIFFDFEVVKLIQYLFFISLLVSVLYGGYLLIPINVILVIMLINILISNRKIIVKSIIMILLSIIQIILLFTIENGIVSVYSIETINLKTYLVFNILTILLIFWVLISSLVMFFANIKNNSK